MIRCTYFSLSIRINLTRTLNLKLPKFQKYVKNMPEAKISLLLEHVLACRRSVKYNRRMRHIFLFPNRTNYIVKQLLFFCFCFFFGCLFALLTLIKGIEFSRTEFLCQELESNTNINLL